MKVFYSALSLKELVIKSTDKFFCFFFLNSTVAEANELGSRSITRQLRWFPLDTAVSSTCMSVDVNDFVRCI